MRGLRLVKLIVVATALAGAAVAYGLSGQAAAHSRAGARVAATAADSYYVLLLTNVDNNIYVGTETSLQSEHNCDLPDGGPPPCSTPIVYTVEAGPFASCAAATAAYDAAAMNPHPAFGGTKVYIFGGSYFIDDMSYWCTPGSSTTTTTTTSTSSTSAGTVPTGTCPIIPVASARTKSGLQTPVSRAPKGKPCLTPAQLAAYRQAYKNAAADASDRAGYYAILLGLCAAFTSNPWCVLGGAAEAAAAIKLNRISSKDPPDPSWRSIVTARAIVLQLPADDGLTSAENSSLNAILKALDTAGGYMDAFMTSVNRASSAAAAHSPVWVQRQIAAEQRFAIATSTAFGSAASISQQAAAQLTALPAVPLSVADLQSAQQQIAAKGLPAALVHAVTLMGLGQAGVASLKSAIVAADPSKLAATDPEILTNAFDELFGPSQIAQERSDQASFLTYGDALAAASTTAASTAPVNLTGSWTNPQTPTAPPWMLTTANSLHTLTGTFAGGAGHSGLRGTVTATLQSNNTVYAGTVHITEGTLSVGGTITITVVSQNKLEVSLKQTNLPNTQVFELDRE